jgi:hypothetical protein
VVEVLHYRATGRLAKPAHDYPLGTLLALLTEQKSAADLAEQQETFGEAPHWTEEPEIVTTGDPLVDKWERELAMGQTPDLDE